MPPNQRKDCDNCYHFGIVSTKLSDLITGLGIYCTILTVLLSWGSYQLYELNGKLSTIATLEKRVERLEKDKYGYEIPIPTERVLAGLDKGNKGDRRM